MNAVCYTMEIKMKKPKRPSRPDVPMSTLLAPDTVEHLSRFCRESGLKKKHVIGLAIRKWLDGQDPQPAKEKP